SAIKIICGWPGRHKDDTAPRIQCHTTPVVGAAARAPSIWRPRFVSRFTRMRNRVKGPSQLTCTHVKGADVSRRRGQALRFATANDDEILVDDTGCREPNPLSGHRKPP